MTLKERHYAIHKHQVYILFSMGDNFYSKLISLCILFLHIFYAYMKGSLIKNSVLGSNIFYINFESSVLDVL